MPITRAGTESILVDRTGALIARVGISLTPSTDLSPRAYLGDPIATSLRQIGISVSDHRVPVDLEIAEVGDDDIGQYLDRAELRLLENIIGNSILIDETAGIDRQAWGKLMDKVQARAALMRDSILDQYGPASSSLNGITSGTVGLNYQSNDDDTVEVSS